MELPTHPIDAAAALRRRARVRDRRPTRPSRIAFFGASLVSSRRNDAATYFRGLLKGLAAEGFSITFFEPASEETERDISNPSWARSSVYAPTEDGARAALREAEAADLIIKASGVGVLDGLLEREVLELQSRRRLVALWDVDAHATLDRVLGSPGDPLRALIPRFDAIFTSGGGTPVVSVYGALGATFCLPVPGAISPELHRPAPRDLRRACALTFLGDRRPERAARVEEFFFSVARRRPQWRFLLGGRGWEGTDVPANVDRLGHVPLADHNALYASALGVLNVHRDSAARYGHAPETRLFEAAGAASCIITDAMVGLELFFEPGHEILIARDGADVTAFLDELSVSRGAEIGQAARRRALAEHTYRHRASMVTAALGVLRDLRADVVPMRVLAAESSI
jgi:spore maturation protein CgeB